MKKTILIPLVLLAVIILGLGYAFWPREAPVPQGKVMSIESYVSQEINTLSPEPAVLGGTFHVTAVEVTPTGEGIGTGIVSYEDGHVAYIADFSYSADDFKGIKISNFVVRK